MPLLAATGCAHAGGIVHQRAYLDAAGDGGIRAASLLDTGDAPAELVVERIDPCGSEVVETRPAAEAASVAAQVRAGAALEEALPPSMAAGEPAWRVAFVASAPLADHRVRTVEVEDDRGDHQAIVLFDPAGRVAELARVHPAALVRVAPLPGGAPRALARVAGPGAIVDLRVLDLAAGARAIALARGEASLAAGDAAAALAAAATAEEYGALSCAASGAPAWLRALALAASEAPAEAILDALAGAIAIEPGLYRMYARMAEELAALRGDPRFDELVAPRPLP